jgi:hypothetical protein
MRLCPSVPLTVVLANVLCFATAASGGEIFPIKQAVAEIVAACAIGPTDYLKEAVSTSLEEFLGQSIETQSANYNKLMDMLKRLPTNTAEAMVQLKNEKGRDTFFAAYFNCLRHQASLKLRSLGIAER